MADDMPSVEYLTGLIERGDPSARERAIDTVADIGRTAGGAAPALVSAMRDASGSIRIKAIEALGLVGAAPALAVPALIDALDDPDDDVSRSAARTLAGLGPTAVPLLIQAFDHSSELVQRRAWDCVARIECVPARLVTTLLAAIARDTRRRVFPRGATERIVPWIEGPAGPLVDALPRSDAETRRFIVRTLARFARGDNRCLDALLGALQDEDESVRCEALVRLEILAKEDPASTRTVWPAVRRSLHDVSGRVRAAAIRSWGAMGGHQTLLDLRRLEDDPEVRDAAIITCWTLTGDVRGMLTLVTEAIRRGDALTALSLARRVGPAANGVLQSEHVLDLFNDPDDEGRLGPTMRRVWAVRIAPDSLDTRSMLEDEDPRVCEAALHALADAGPSAAPLVPRLREMLRDGNAWHRVLAARAIWGIVHRAGEIIEVLGDLLETAPYACNDEEFYQYWRPFESMPTVWPEAIGLIEGIARQHPDVVSRHLIRCVAAESPHVAVNACRILLRLGREQDRVIERVAGLLRWRAFPTSIAAIELAWMMGPAGHPLVHALASWLEDPLSFYRWYAATALASIGAACRSVVTQIGAALDDPEDPMVQEAAALAIGAIDPDGSAALAVLRLVVTNRQVRRKVSQQLQSAPETLPSILDDLVSRYSGAAARS